MEQMDSEKVIQALCCVDLEDAFYSYDEFEMYIHLKIYYDDLVDTMKMVHEFYKHVERDAYDDAERKRICTKILDLLSTLCLLRFYLECDTYDDTADELYKNFVKDAVNNGFGVYSPEVSAYEFLQHMEWTVDALGDNSWLDCLQDRAREMAGTLSNWLNINRDNVNERYVDSIGSWV